MDLTLLLNNNMHLLLRRRSVAAVSVTISCTRLVPDDGLVLFFNKIALVIRCPVKMKNDGQKRKYRLGKTVMNTKLKYITVYVAAISSGLRRTGACFSMFVGIGQTKMDLKF